MKHFVYIHSALGAGIAYQQPYYVGIGSRKHAYNIKKTNNLWMRFYNLFGRVVDFTHPNGYDTFEEAEQVAKSLITQYQKDGYPLANVLDQLGQPQFTKFRVRKHHFLHDHGTREYTTARDLIVRYRLTKNLYSLTSGKLAKYRGWVIEHENSHNT